MRPPSRRGAPVTTANQAVGLRSGPGAGAAVEVSHLRKTYGPVVAVDDVPFSVAEGEIFGILGPNGAGKTTTVECVTGLRTPTRASPGSWAWTLTRTARPARDRGSMGDLFR